MAIAKKPNSTPSDIAKNEARVANFIEGASTPKGAADEKRVAVIVRFKPDALRLIDAAAKKRGVSRSSLIQMVMSRALEAGEG